MREMKLAFLSTTAVACALLSGCASNKPPEARCRAAGAQDQLGKTVDERVLADARAGAAALRSRVVPYGTPETGDVDPMRLNVEVDPTTQRIRRLRCG
jgi:hypothetical protein